MNLFKKIECVYVAPNPDYYLVRLDRDNEEKIERLKELVPSAKKDHETGHYLVPANAEYGAALRQLRVPFSREAFKHKLKRKSYEARLIELSKSLGYDLEIDGFGKKPYPFQNAGIDYAYERERVIIGDEMGLGKTIQGLGLLHKAGDDALPALIVTPKSNKFNWAETEIPACLPGKVVILAEKNTPPLLLQAADIIVCHYEQLVGSRTVKSRVTEEIVTADGDIEYRDKEVSTRTSWTDPTKKKVILSPLAEQLQKLGLRSIIADEAHYIKETHTARTHALMDIRHSARYRALLTGTPVQNRAAEAWSLIKFLDRTAEFGGYWHFHKHYCGQRKGKYGIEAKESRHTIEFNTKLRATCYVRRLKKEVLQDLPPKQRTSYAIEITNRDEYDKAEKELLQWVRDRVERDKAFLDSIAHLPVDDRQRAIEERKDAKAAAAKRGEMMVRINALKTVAAEGKMKAAKEWIDNFLETGEKLVVFATHRFLHEWLLKTYLGSARIIAEDAPDVRQNNVVRFQNDPACKLIVCAMGTSTASSPAGIGHTLTAASNVLFLELGWNNAHHDQCEDRCHRIGQKDCVNCHYLLGRRTIEIKIAELIESKRSLVSQIVDGKEIEGDVGIMDDLIDYLEETAA